MKKCPICKKEFKSYHNIKKYCSNKCYKINKKNHQKDYYLTIKQTKKYYYLKHKKEIKNNQKIYRETHKEQLNEYIKNKRKYDINFRISDCLRLRIRKVLKDINKSKSTLKLLNCSIEQLKQYLESKFTKGMSWSNYGKWHIDHIKPCASFDLSKPEEQRKCFHYTNLQPLWAKDNLRKNATI